MGLRPDSSALDVTAGLLAVEEQSHPELPAHNGPGSSLLDSPPSSLGSPRETGVTIQSTGLPAPNPTLPPTATTAAASHPPDAQQLYRFASLPQHSRPVADPESSLPAAMSAATCLQTWPASYKPPISQLLPTVKPRPAAGSQAGAVVPASLVSHVRLWGLPLLLDAKHTH